MAAFELTVLRQDYSAWEWSPASPRSDYPCHPAQAKLFHGDVVNERGQLIERRIMNTQRILFGVLCVHGSTFGKSENGKPLYQCVPVDRTLPIFLVPYEKKAGFNKTNVPLYVAFRLLEWRQTKHPLGQLTQTFGPCNALNNIVAFDLTRYELAPSLTPLSQKVAQSIGPLSETELLTRMCNVYSNYMEDRRHCGRVFAIDPVGCKDVDDAFGVRQLVIDPNVYIISIYIANVPLWLDFLDVWSAVTTRVSSIYLPDAKKNMLPDILSENLCSLRKQTERPVVTLDIKINIATEEIMHINLDAAMVYVTDNFVYEEPALLKLMDYQCIRDLAVMMNKKKELMPSILDSHDVVQFYMLFMNEELATRLMQQRAGIFRKCKAKWSGTACPDELKFVLADIKAEYCLQADLESHAILNLSSYAHTTSPIRRLVDVVNLTYLQKNALSPTALAFAEMWSQNLIQVNAKTKQIKRLQQQTQLWTDYMKKRNRDIYAGRVIRIDEAKQRVEVYVPDLRITRKLPMQAGASYEQWMHCRVQLFMFEDEPVFWHKIKLAFVYTQ
jgi:exoribonuclease R